MLHAINRLSLLLQGFLNKASDIRIRKPPTELQASYSRYRSNSKVVSIHSWMLSYTTFLPFLQSRIREVYRNLGEDRQFHLDEE